MRFETYDHAKLEPDIQAYWKKSKTVEKLRKRNKGKQKFYFLDGPPYTSGRIHLGHAWNKALKDMVLRYKRMKNLDVWDRAGFDMHGLPTEHKVMAKFELKNKDDIEKFGYEKFAEECRKFCTEMMHAMIGDFERIGTTLDYTDPYQPIKTEYTNAVWGLIRKANDDKRLYLGKRTLHWDPKDQTALAKHELFYKPVQDTSIYVKFKVANIENEYLLIWTTTPWTIPYNLFIMAHPKLEYVKVEVGGEILIMAKSLLEKVMDVVGKEYEIKSEFTGEQLEGLKYEHFWADKIPDLQKLREDFEKVHTVLLNEVYVNDSDGTGLVHGAPGCGPEDYEVGHLHKIPPFNTLNESGVCGEDTGPFAGMKARYDDSTFTEMIDRENALAGQKKYTHDYPHAERSKEPVIFRTTPQWFLKIENLKEEMVKNNEEVHWVPLLGKTSFKLWLENLRDNSITKQRFWGTPAPIWKSEDGDFHVIGSVKELKELAKEKLPKDLHKPWIDDVVIVKDGKEYRRIPDVLDVWIDPGCASWTCLYYPEKEDLFERWYEADFIVEGKDQVRAWFNLLWICSHLYLKKPSFKNVHMHGMLNDVDGVKMSKSLGNIISPYEIIDKHGADVVRYYMCETGAGEDINFSWDECILKQRNLLILWNMHKLLLNLAEENNFNPFKVDLAEIEQAFCIEEKYILSKLHSTIKEVTILMEEYRLDETIEVLEELYLELSRTYIQMVRDKSSVGNKIEKLVCAYTIGHVLLECVKMFHIIVPFVTEGIFLNFKEEFSLDEESISHYAWPVSDESKIDRDLEKQMMRAQAIIQSALHAREKAKRGLRWPVQEIVVVSTDETAVKAVENLQEILKKQINAKSVVVKTGMENVTTSLTPVHAKIGPVYGKDSKEVIKMLNEQDAEKIVKHFSTNGYFEFPIGSKSIKITPEMVNVDHSAPEGYEASSFRRGDVFLSLEFSPELETEGFARELMRKVQDMRKKAGLAKTDNVSLYIDTDKDLDAFTDDIKAKVGATSLSWSKASEEMEEFSVKGISFRVWFEKV
jgi:isoleucyl-tRNA synthetase